MMEILHNATFAHWLAGIIVLAYFLYIICGGKLLKNFLKSVIIIALVAFCGWIAMVWMQHNHIRQNLSQMVSITNFEKKISERLASGTNPSDIKRELEKKKLQIKNIANDDKFYDKVLGKSETIDSLLKRLNRDIDNQIFRLNNMGMQSKESYSPTDFILSPETLTMIHPVVTEQPYINVGVVIDEEAIFRKENNLLVRIVRMDNDSLLYQQAFVPKKDANSFVLPNYFNDDSVQLQIGYINKTERNTYHYISCIPYERK